MLSETSQLPEDKRCMTPPMRGRRVDSSPGTGAGAWRGGGGSCLKGTVFILQGRKFWRWLHDTDCA